MFIKSSKRIKVQQFFKLLKFIEMFRVLAFLTLWLSCFKSFGIANDSPLDSLFTNLYNTLDMAKDDLTNPDMWPKDYAEELQHHSGNIVHDYIVIGAGTAGSVVASRLSEDPSVSVLVLEAGGNPPALSEVHTLSLLLMNTSYSWNDYAEPNPYSCHAMKDGRCYWLRGKMIGGTGGINGNIFLPGYPEDYDEWHSQGNKEWSWNDVFPYFVKATEDSDSLKDPKGSLKLSNFLRLPNFEILSELMTNGTQEVEHDYATKSQGFMENITALVDRGRRMSTGKTYLGKVAKFRKNLHVLKNAVARKVLITRRNKAIGVEFQLNDSKIFTIKAKKEIILSAGAFNSAKILLSSGIGPCHHLKSLGIACLKNLPVGRNLQDHGMMPLQLIFTRNIPDRTEEDSLISTFEYLAYQKGPLAADRNLVGLVNTLANHKLNRADIYITSAINRPSADSNVFKILQFGDEFVSQYVKKTENHTTLEMSGLIIKPKSRGYVQLKSSDPLEGPLIYNNHAKEPEDRLKLLSYVRFVQGLINTPSFQHYGLQLVRIHVDECDSIHVYDSDEYWLCYIKYFYISAWHAAGTCHMGPASSRSAVVDSRLRVHGIEGLRVIDASIMPNITSGNTNGPTIMIGEKGSQMIKDDEWPNAI